AASVVLLNQFEGQTVCLDVRAAEPSVTLLKGQTQWCHTFPAKPQAPTFDNLTSTITIPDVAGASYQVDGQPVAPGTITLKVPFGGQWVTVTATVQGSPTVYTWKNRFPEVVTPNAPVFDDGQQRLITPINKGVYWYIDGYNDGKPLVAGNTVDMSAYAGQTIRMYAVAAQPAVTLLTGQTEWFHTFPARPDRSIANGDEFDGEGLSKYWRIYTQDTPANRKSLYRPESVSVHDGVLDMRTRRHCIADEREKLTDANATTAVCPAGKITRYSTGRVDTNYIYGMPARVEVRAKLDPEHHGITSTGWMHNDQPFCNNGVTTTDIAEMDIMEVWATNYSKTFSHITCDGGKYHTNGVETHQWIPGEWHTWGVEWDGHALRYYFDGKLQTGPYGSEITAQTLGITQERFLSAMHDHMWQFVINVTAPVDGGWAPWIDDTLPFRDRHDLYDYVRIQPFVQMDCQPYGLIGEYAARHPELGRSTGCEYAAGVPGSRAQNFEHGRVYWSPATGAQPVSGAVLDKFLRSGGERRMGLPTNPPLAIRDGGTSQTFQNVTILHSPATGAHWVRGLIRDKYALTGWENGKLGYPVTDEVCGLRDNGCYQRFQFDDHIYWSAGTGAHSVLGAIYQKYASMGWENGDFGYPVTDEICGLRDGGCVQRFQHANGHIYWSPATGAHFTRGLIQDRYGAMGWENSTIGYPVTDEICGIRDGGCYQRFQRESGHLYWSPASGSWGVQGAICAYWGSAGWENGRLGYPTGPERCANRPGALECDQSFQRGRITWSSAHGARG
ncbi:family 16 glycosylhydrolase, partial [Mariniluteicoccus endophyticus]